MKLILVLSGALFLTSCSYLRRPVPTVSVPVAPTPPATAPIILPSPTPAQPVVAKPQVIRNTTIPSAPVTLPSPIVSPPSSTSHPLRYQEVNANGITFHLVTFDTSEYTLKVADQSTLGGNWPTAKTAALNLGGVAAVNGGFFNADGSPLGLVRSGGKSAGSWNTASSLASGVYQYSQGRCQLLRNRNANRSATELLQTGPFLVENHATVSGLSRKRVAQRSILLWDGGNHFALGITSSCTLGDLSPAIKALPSSIPQKTALNLDGGRSTDLYVSSKVSNGGTVKGHWLKSQVRNYLVLRKK